MLEMNLYLDPADSRALYQQLYENLARQIKTGQLRAGEKLPGKRSLSAQLAVAVNTVDTAGGPGPPDPNAGASPARCAL